MLSISVDFIESKEMGEKIYRQKNSFDFKFAFQNLYNIKILITTIARRSNNLIFSEYPKRRKEIFF